jgi:hypothetical protein
MSRDVVRKANLIRYTVDGVQKTQPNTPKNYLQAKGYNIFNTDNFIQLTPEVDVEKDPVYCYFNTESHFSYIQTPNNLYSITDAVLTDSLEEVILYLEKDTFEATNFQTTYTTPQLEDSQCTAV